MQRRLRRLRPVERGRRDIQPTHGTRKTGRSTQRPDPAALVHRQRRSHNLDHAGRRGQRRHPVQGDRQYRTQRHRRHEGRRLLGTDPRYERGERRTLLDDYRRRKHRFSERHRRLENPRCGAYSRNGRRQRGLLDPQRPAIDRCVGKPGESRRKADVAHHRNLARRQRQRHLHAGRRIDRIRHRYSTPSTSSSRSATPPSTTSTPSKTFRSHSRSVTRSRAKRPTKRS